MRHSWEGRQHSLEIVVGYVQSARPLFSTNLALFLSLFLIEHFLCRLPLIQMLLSFLWLARSGDVVNAPLLLISFVPCRALTLAVADAIRALAASWHLVHFRFEIHDLSAVALLLA